MNALTVTHPTLPTRNDLLVWLQETDGGLLSVPPSVFYLDSHDAYEADVVAEWLKRRYAFASVQADGWMTLTARGHGIVMIFSVEDVPHAIGYMKSFEIVHSVLEKAGAYQDDYGRVTREELLLILLDWEYPHAVAERILQARRLADLAPPGADEGG